MKRIVIALLTVAVIGGVLFSGCVATPSPAPPTPPTAPAAEFRISNLVITPSEPQVWETVELQATVANVGDVEGSHTITLLIDEAETERQNITLAAHAADTVSFEFAKHVAGAYKIQIDGVSETLVIRELPSVAPEKFEPVYTNPQTYRVTRTLTIRNETARVDQLKVWMPGVVDWDSQKNVVTEETTPSPSSVRKDPQYGSGILYWEFRDEPSRGSSLTITDQFIYTCWEVNYYIELDKIAAYDNDDPEYILFTRSGNYLEANDPEIMETAKEIVGDETNPYTVAHSIYEWVIDHMTYQLIEESPGGAKFAFENGYGECGDYSALFVALCRAAGIPARPVVGRWATSKADDWHVWAEFYLPGYGWVPVDPTIADRTGKLEDNFGHLDNRRLIVNKTYNIVLHPEPHFFASKVGFLQTLVWEYHGLSGEIQLDLDYSVRPVAGD